MSNKTKVAAEHRGNMSSESDTVEDEERKLSEKRVADLERQVRNLNGDFIRAALASYDARVAQNKKDIADYFAGRISKLPERDYE